MQTGVSHVQILRAEGAGLPSQLEADIASKEEEIASLQHEVCTAATT